MLRMRWLGGGLLSGLLSALPGQVGCVEGRVLGQDGLPVPNVEVVARADGRGLPVLARSRSDGEGMFVLNRLPTGQGCQVLASLPGHTRASAYASLSPATPFAVVQLRLWQANTLRGRVVGPDGAPLAGAHVLGSKDLTWFDGRFVGPEVRTDDAGHFELPGVPIGDCVVVAFAPGYAMRQHWLTATADAEVQVRLDRQGGTRLAIQATGLPDRLESAPRVQVYPTRGGTGFAMLDCIETNVLDGAGRLDLTGLVDAEWHVGLSAPGFTFDPRQAATKMGDRDARLEFRAVADGAVTLRGVLRDVEGHALAGQRLLCRAQRSSSMNGGRPGEAVTDAAGHFEMIAPLVAGEGYSLHLVDSPWVLQQEQAARPAKRRGGSDLRDLVRWEEIADPERELELVAVPGAVVRARLQDDAATRCRVAGSS